MKTKILTALLLIMACFATNTSNAYQQQKKKHDKPVHRTLPPRPEHRPMKKDRPPVPPHPPVPENRPHKDVPPLPPTPPPPPLPPHP